MHDSPRIWFITGAAHGLGRVLAQAALARGDVVIGTGADADALDLIDIAAGRGEFHALAMSPTSAASVRAAFAGALALHGRIDVVVSHADDEAAPRGAEAAQLFDLHFLGPLRVMQTALPILRAQGHGHYVDVSSRALAPRRGWDVYAVAAAAVLRRVESLAEEMRPLGVEVLRIDPDEVDAGLVDCFGQSSAFGACGGRHGQPASLDA